VGKSKLEVTDLEDYKALLLTVSGNKNFTSIWNEDHGGQNRLIEFKIVNSQSILPTLRNFH